MTKTVSELLAEAAAVDVALREHSEEELLAELLARLNDPVLGDHLAGLMRLAVAAPPTQVVNVVQSFIATYSACVAQTEIRHRQVVQAAEEAQEGQP